MSLFNEQLKHSLKTYLNVQIYIYMPCNNYKDFSKRIWLPFCIASYETFKDIDIFEIS